MMFHKGMSQQALIAFENGASLTCRKEQRLELSPLRQSTLNITIRHHSPALFQPHRDKHINNISQPVHIRQHIN